AYRGLLRLDQGGLVERHPHAEDVGRAEQAVGMLLQPEDGGAVVGLVGAYPLEDAHAVMQRVGEHVGGGVAPRHHLAVVPDQAVAVGHRFGYCHLEFPCLDFGCGPPWSANVKSTHCKRRGPALNRRGCRWRHDKNSRWAQLFCPVRVIARWTMCPGCASAGSRSKVCSFT